MLAEVIRRLEEYRTEPTEALKIVRSEVKLGRKFPTQKLDSECSPPRGLGWTTHPKKKQAETILATPKTAIHHNIGDAGNTTINGTSSGTQWSSCDTRRNGSGIHGDDNVETREHESVRTTNPSKSVPEVVVESKRVTEMKIWKNLTKTMLWNHRLMENDEYERLT